MEEGQIWSGSPQMWRRGRLIVYTWEGVLELWVHLLDMEAVISRSNMLCVLWSSIRLLRACRPVACPNAGFMSRLTQVRRIYPAPHTVPPRTNTCGHTLQPPSNPRPLQPLCNHQPTLTTLL